jgi:hypothetical protein
MVGSAAEQQPPCEYLCWYLSLSLMLPPASPSLLCLLARPQVGFHLMMVSDAFKSFLLASCAALTIFSTSHMPFLATTAATSVVLTAMGTWMCLPNSLAPGYTHLKLNMKWREQRVVMFSGPKSPHLSLLASVLDMAGLAVLGYLLVTLRSTAGMIAVNGAAFAASIVGMFLAVNLLQSRSMQLHIQNATLLLAALPGAALFKGLAAMQLAPQWQLLLVVAAVQVVMGARGPLNGLLAMMTLPSREAVALWQLAGVILCNSALLITILVAGTLKLAAAQLVTPLLAALGVIEGARLLCSIGLFRMHPKENLCAL